MKWFSNFEFKAFGRNLYEKAMETDVLGNSAQVAFYFVLAFFPLLLFLMTLGGEFLESREHLQADLFNYLGQVMPGSAFELVQTTLNEIIEGSSGGLLTFGAIATLWSASAGVSSLQSALNEVYEVDEDRSWWYTKLQAVALTFLFIILIVFALSIAAAGAQLLQSIVAALGFEVSSPWVLQVVQWAVVFVALLFVTAVVYSWLPSFEEFNWVWISPGAVLAILLWVLLTVIFRVYLQYFNSYSKAYGSLGAVIILLLWMYLTALALLIGGAINSVMTEMAEGSGAKEAQKDEKQHAVNEAEKAKKDEREPA